EATARQPTPSPRRWRKPARPPAGKSNCFNTPEQQTIDEMDVAQAEEYIAEGQFAPGSMLPKVEACIEYVEAYPEGRALITSPPAFKVTLAGWTSSRTR
ncbi:hypothetical protein NE591_14650, partial [Adlercreutzia sp. DFI.6.23]|nr:hypothetical protein [Adlercreutzia sp. DFI.6.23]